VKIIDAVIPVAGLGTRLLPATRSQPKEMLPVVDKPVVQYVVEELMAAGIERVLFVTGRRKRAIEDHFDADPELERALGLDPPLDPRGGLKVLYTRQLRPAGLGDALRYAEGFGDGRGVVVALGDSIIAPLPASGPAIIERLVQAYTTFQASAALAVVEVEDDEVASYGIVSGTEIGDGIIEVTDVIEKPDPSEVPSRLAVAARYVLGPSVFAALRDTAPDARGEVQLADALRAVLREGGRIVAVPLGGGERRHDIGTVDGYCHAFLELALADPRVGAALRAHAATLLDRSR
ncbi:MAG TPA: UTP--glucose-1-phosphate uridylyltransferase, partial [Solirubrobacteraceae bacterium]|nr:UTP--glucose-1-phosphate uridylyltransferase [Solirubrobacteraceae bacterium]